MKEMRKKAERSSSQLISGGFLLRINLPVLHPHVPKSKLNFKMLESVVEGIKLCD